MKDSVKLSGKTDFSGYDRLSGVGRVTALIFDGAVVDRLSVGQEGQVVLDQTPFYAEGGGQMGDSGTLCAGEARIHGPRYPENRCFIRALRRRRVRRVACR